MNKLSIHEWVNKYGELVRDLVPPIRQNLPYPKSIDNLDHLFKNVIFVEPRALSKAIFSSVVHNVYVTGDGNVISQDKANEISEFSSCENAYSLNPVTVDNAVHLISQWSNTNYWHWFSSSLTRLYATENFPDDTKYIINGHSRFVDGSLNVIGVNLKNCIDMSRISCVFCKNLYLPSMMNDFNKEGFIFIRNKIKSLITPKNNSKRIYISRVGKRVVNNEKEVSKFLFNMGFQMVRCENLSFEDQVKTFYDAEIVVAPHGAGLTNAMFAADNAKILELRNPQYFGRCYYYLSRHLGYDYWTLLGNGKVPESSKEMQGTLYNNMDISIDKLDATLKAMNVK